MNDSHRSAIDRCGQSAPYYWHLWMDTLGNNVMKADQVQWGDICIRRAALIMRHGLRNGLFV
jgi:hypothetical protein